MPIEALAQELLKREIAKDPNQYKAPMAESRPAPERKLSPGMLAVLGGIADTASTYAFAKTGQGREDNPALAGIKSPGKLAVASMGGLLASRLAAKLLGKVSPAAADALSANLGAEQLGLAVTNTNIAAGKKGVSAFDTYHNTLLRHQKRTSEER